MAELGLNLTALQMRQARVQLRRARSHAADEAARVDTTCKRGCGCSVQCPSTTASCNDEAWLVLLICSHVVGCLGGGHVYLTNLVRPTCIGITLIKLHIGPGIDHESMLHQWRVAAQDQYSY